MKANARIAGIGTALPPGELTLERARSLLPELLGLTGRSARAYDALMARSGVERRRSALIAADGSVALYAAGEPEPGTAARMAAWCELAGPLAADAARAALERAGWSGSEVTHLVLVTCTGFASPGLDVALFDALGLAAHVQRVQVGFMGCHGAINGLRVANGLLAAQPEARVLLVAAELCSLHLSREAGAGQGVAAALFADGAAALALDGEVGAADPWTVLDTGSLRLPGTEALMGWRVGDRGFAMELSPEVPAAIETALAEPLRAWLAARGTTPERIGGWAVHPGGVRVLDAVEHALELDGQALGESRRLLRELGNLSSPTVLFLLERFRASAAPAPHLLLAFGPGLFAEFALIG